MPLVINRLSSDVYVEPPRDGESDGDSGGSAREPIDSEDFLLRYGPSIRTIVRDEMDRYLRNLAD